MVVGGIGFIHRLQERPRVFMSFQDLKHCRIEIGSDRTLNQTLTKIKATASTNCSVGIPLYKSV